MRQKHKKRDQHPDPAQTTLCLPEVVGATYDILADWMQTLPWYRDEDIPQMILDLVPSTAKSVLELCCGSGKLASYLAPRRFRKRLTVIDISARMAELAEKENRTHKNVRIINGNWIQPVLNNPEKGELFDCVIIKNALHLIPELPERLQELRTITTDDACLIIVETVSPNKVTNIFIRGLFEIVDTQRVKSNYFTKNTLPKQLRDGGWQTTGKYQYKDQHIQVEDWLSHKCNDPQIAKRAKEWITNASSEVRSRLEFTHGKELTTTMLRKQMIIKCSQKKTERRQKAKQQMKLI